VGSGVSSETTAMEKETLGRDHWIGRFPEMAKSSVEVSDEAFFAKVEEVESVVGRGRRGPSGGHLAVWDGVERMRITKAMILWNSLIRSILNPIKEND
jgi:hypothetical protein